MRELKTLTAHANIAPAAGAHTTVAALLDQWFARGRATWSPTTVRNLTSIVERHLKPGLGDILVGDLTTAIVDEFYKDLRSGGRIDGKALAVGTVRRIHSALHAALAQAQRWSWVFENVADQATPPRGEPSEMRPPTPGQVAQLLEFVARDPALHLYLTLAATTGARRGQLLALRWIDVDLVGGSLSIQRSLVDGPDGPLLVPTKTRRSHRVALDGSSLELLRRQHNAAEVGGGEVLPEDRFVFSSDEAGTRPWSPNFVTKRFIRVRRASGLSHFRLHDLRHFMATQMLDAGVPIPIVAARLCHARASTTLNVYAHAVPGGDRLAAEALWQRVDQAHRKRQLPR
ncbi:MAG TPA: site-specific integrase [Acidimicrobiales bacterium]|jgi:integrase|nr:site-specific integrase [Acidimicrobiales bacterium]